MILVTGNTAYGEVGSMSKFFTVLIFARHVYINHKIQGMPVYKQ